jgi:hypothetical protein
MTVQHERRFIHAVGLESQTRQNGSQGIEMCAKPYADSLERGTTNENAIVWACTLQVTKDKCIERQEQMDGGTGLHIPAKPNRPVAIWTQS